MAGLQGQFNSWRWYKLILNRCVTGKFCWWRWDVAGCTCLAMQDDGPTAISCRSPKSCLKSRIGADYQLNIPQQELNNCWTFRDGEFTRPSWTLWFPSDRFFVRVLSPLIAEERGFSRTLMYLWTDFTWHWHTLCRPRLQVQKLFVGLLNVCVCVWTHETASAYLFFWNNTFI